MPRASRRRPGWRARRCFRRPSACRWRGSLPRLAYFPSQSLIDLYSASSMRPIPTPWARRRRGSCGWPLSARTSMRACRHADHLGQCAVAARPVAAQVLLARARVTSVRALDLQSDAPDLVASLLAGGFDREAARWAGGRGNGRRAWRRGLGDAGAWRTRRAAAAGGARAGSRLSPTATRARASSARLCSSPASPGSGGSTRRPRAG